MGIRSWLGEIKAKLDAAALESKKREQERKTSLAKKREEDRQAEALMVEIRAKWAIDEAKGTDGRLQEHYDAMQAGKISLEDYKSQIELEIDLAKIEIESLRNSRRDMDRDDYEAQREKADEDLEAGKWRLGWVNRQIREKGDRPEWMGKSGKWARFQYADADGEIKTHDISMWKAYSKEVRGWVRKSKSEVGFSYDKITNWQAG
ncbi:hypothetical protein GTZ99_03050 [Novosphingobium sp. FSY-8]|uniref:Uncharacterized protein n=1 Tax=Novosphingobium ovatum TaxID=1908523 RepID=A0ABW9XAI9_9SPHN|nr:hypothetical protein [Novosphingobium ovatum]NBC35529.1 hypothetical protein [Novosphingobium ovatum]